MAAIKPAAIYLVKITKSVNNPQPYFLFPNGGRLEHTNQKLQSLLALWHDQRGTKALPSRGDFAVSALRPWLGNLALIDLQNEAVFRLCGTNLHNRFGGEMTRRKIADLGNEYAAALLKVIAQVRDTRRPSLATHECVVAGMPTMSCELCVPLSDDGVNVDTLMFASYPIPRK